MEEQVIEIVAIGDEILLGQTLDTNSNFIGRELAGIGLRLRWLTVVGDREDDMRDAIERALRRSKVVIVTGGLGPTSDDRTRPVLAKIFDDDLEWRQDLADAILARFKRGGSAPSPGWESMAHFPTGAISIPNSHGSAPGIHYVREGSHLFAIPGVPAEMRGMVMDYILPVLQKLREGVFLSRIFKTVGTGESYLAKRIGDQSALLPATLAFLPSLDSGVTLRLSCFGDDYDAVNAVLDSGAEQIHNAVTEYIYAERETTLEVEILDLLRQRGKKLALAESCTGGMIASRLTGVPGASDVFERGFVTYSNRSKVEVLGVEPNIIEKFGAVSAECAGQMAEGARRVAGTDFAVSVTGIAGPGGGTSDKPVGLVYIGIADSDGCEVKRYVFTGDRDDNRRRSALAALGLLWKRIVLDSGSRRE